MKKVSAHVCKSLGIKLPVMSATDVAAAREWTPAEAVEIVCNKQACDPNLTLAAARQFIWKSSDDLVLYYRWTENYKRYLAHKEKGS